MAKRDRSQETPRLPRPPKRPPPRPKPAPGSKCGAKLRRKDGRQCRLPAGHGTDHPGFGRCKFHGGASPGGKLSAKRQEAQLAVTQLSLSRKVDPQTALLEEVHRTAGRVAFIERQVAALDGDKAVWDLSRRVQQTGGEAGTIIGRVESLQMHPWLRLFQIERAHLVHVCEVAIRCGIAERQVKLAEQQGRLLVEVIRKVLVAAGVDPSKPNVVSAMRDALLAASAAESAGEVIDVEVLAT